MKKIIPLLLLLTLFMKVLAQNFEWKKLSLNNDVLNLTSLSAGKEQNIYGIFCKAENKKNLPEKNVARVYNYDLTEIKEIPLSPETPYYNEIKKFKNNYAIVGCDRKFKGAVFEKYLNSLIIFTDNQMNQLKKIDLPVHDPNYEDFDRPNAYLSYDSAYLIVKKIEKPSLGKPTGKTNKNQYDINVFDKDLNVVWSDYIDFDKVFGKDVLINNYYFQYINNSLYIIASSLGDKVIRKIPMLFIVKYEKPDSSKIIYKEKFANNDFCFDYIITDDQNIIVSGLADDEFVRFYYIKINLKDVDSKPILLSTNFDKSYKEKYPELKDLRFNDINKLRTFPTEDGYYVTYEMIFYDNDNYWRYFMNNIFIFYVTNKGNILWHKVNCRNIDVDMNLYKWYSYYKVAGNNLYMIYHDTEKSMKEKSNELTNIKDVQSHGKICLGFAFISSDAKVSKTFIIKERDLGIYVTPNDIKPLSDTKFIIRGNGASMKNVWEGNIGIFDVNP